MNSESNQQEPFVVRTPEEFKQMPEEYRELIIHLMMKHTEGELSGVDDYLQIFFPMAPNAYEKKVCCERAAEEMDHYMRGAAVLKDIGVDVSYMLDQKLSERKLYATEGVQHVRSWPARGLFSFVGEDAVLDHIKEMAECSYRPMAESFTTVIRDEKVHVAHGARIVRALCQTDEGRAQVEDALVHVWPKTLDLFGKSNSKRNEAYRRWGIRQRSNEEARELFSKRARPKLEALGLTVPPDDLNRKFM